MPKALSDPVRLMSVIASHSGGEACVSDISVGIAVSQPTISHHLKVLRTACLLDSERRGSWVYYRVIPQALQQLSTLLGADALAGDRRWMLWGWRVRWHCLAGDGGGSLGHRGRRTVAPRCRAAAAGELDGNGLRTGGADPAVRPGLGCTLQPHCHGVGLAVRAAFGHRYQRGGRHGLCRRSGVGRNRRVVVGRPQG